MSRRRRNLLLRLGIATLPLLALALVYRFWAGPAPAVFLSADTGASGSLIAELEAQSEHTSIDAFESARAERATRALSMHEAVDPYAAVYFFPELLPPQSLERDFAYLELKPSLTALRQAVNEGAGPQASQAYRLLENRVTSYELGAVGLPQDLSPEARVFLRIYGRFADRAPAQAKR